MSDTNLGEELRKARGDRSLSDISRICGLPVSTLSRIEKGDIETPGRETLEAVARGYDRPLEWLAQLVYLGKPAAERGVTVSPERSGATEEESGEWTPTTKPTKRKSLSPTSP